MKISYHLRENLCGFFVLAVQVGFTICHNNNNNNNIIYPDLTGKNILVVEDNELNTEIITEILSETHGNIYSAINGAAALSSLRTCFHKRFNKVLKCAIFTIDSAELIVIS